MPNNKTSTPVIMVKPKEDISKIGETDGHMLERSQQKQWEQLDGEQQFVKDRRKDQIPNKIINCPFAIHFCPERGTTERIKTHLRDDRILHLVLLCKSIIHLRQVRDATIINNLGNLKILQSQVTLSQVIVNRFNSQCMFHVRNIEKSLRGLMKSNDKHEIIGQPFETHRYGYKLLPIICIHADKQEQTEYLSIMVSLMPGDYDPILKWPFQYPIRFAIADQKGSKQLEKVITILSLDKMEKIKHPTNERNAAFGIKTFLPLADIGKYTVNKDLYVSITVEISTKDMCSSPSYH